MAKRSAGHVAVFPAHDFSVHCVRRLRHHASGTAIPAGTLAGRRRAFFGRLAYRHDRRHLHVCGVYFRAVMGTCFGSHRAPSGDSARAGWLCADGGVFRPGNESVASLSVTWSGAGYQISLLQPVQQRKSLLHAMQVQ